MAGFTFLCLLLFCLSACSAPAPQARQSYQSFDGQTLSYLDVGDGPLVLMLHGLTGSAEAHFGETGLIEAVTARGYRVIAPDLRGHGRSGVANIAGNWPADALARDQAALLDHLDATPHAVVGYSLGALVALRLQARDAPAQRLVIGGMGDRTAVTGDRTRHDGLAALLADVAEGGTGPQQSRIIALLDASGSEADKVAGALRRRMTLTPEALSRFDIPVLVLNGDTDFDNGDGAALAAFIPGAEFETVTGDHLGALRNPAYGAAVADFIAAAVP